MDPKRPPSPVVPQGTALLWLLVALASGIAVDRASSGIDLDVRWRVSLWWTLATLSVAVWWLLYRRGRYFASSLLVLPVAFGLGGAWHTWNWKAFDVAEVGRSAPMVSEPCCVEAIALSHVQRTAAPATSRYRAIPSGEQSQLQVEVVQIRNGQEWQRAHGKCQLIVDGHLLGLKPNDRLRIYGQWQAILPPSNPGEFDYRSFARARRELCTLRTDSPDSVSISERGHQWRPNTLLSHWNAQAQSRIWRDLNRRTAPVACAVLLGANHALPRELKEHYLLTGATHVLVVSGLHAGILVGGVFFLLRMGLLPRRVSLAVAMVLIVAYAMFTGANPPVVRAAVLAEIVCVGLWLGVASISINSLAAAALTVLLLNPAELFLTGTQLSFLCSATLMWIASVVATRHREADPLDKLVHGSRPRVVRLLERLARWSGLLLLTSLVLWLVTMPLVSMQFNVISPISVPSSLLVLPTVTFALASGVAYLLTGSLVPGVAPFLAWLCEWLFWLLDSVVWWTSELPFSHTWTPGPPGWWVAGFYLILALLLRTGGIRGGWQRLAQVMALWVLVGAAPTLVARHLPRPLEVAFLDVGHGASVVVTTPEGMTLVYDAGGMGSPERATEAVANYLWSRGVQKIDGLILSHADVDHYNGVPGLLLRFPIDRVFVSPHMFPPGDDPADNSAPASLRRLLTQHKIPIEELVMGDRLTLGETTTAEVLYPDFLGSLGSDNANSLVVAVEHRGVRVLLPGDLESPGLEALLADTPYDCDVLLAPHHGSSRSDPPGFAAWCQPEHVVISGGVEFSAPQVAATYRLAGAEVYSTAERGAIIFKILNERISTQFIKGSRTHNPPKD